MALRSISPNELEQWGSLLHSAARDIRQARAQLHASELPKVELEASLAIKYMEYIREWATRTEMKAQSRKLEARLTMARNRFQEQR